MQANAHAPYSHFLVGAALRTPSGQVYVGCNVENSSYPEGTCAEAGAIAAMAAAGERAIEVILTIADGTSKTAAADQERTSTLGDAQVGIARIADDLRNACVLFGANGVGSAGAYCRVNFTAPPGNSACTRSSDCIDAIINTRTNVTRPAGSVTRGLMRI